MKVELNREEIARLIAKEVANRLNLSVVTTVQVQFSWLPSISATAEVLTKDLPPAKDR